MPLDSFAPAAFAAAATAAGPSAVCSVSRGAWAPRDSVESNPEFYANREFFAVIASLLRKTFVTGDFGATGFHAVSLPDGVVDTDTAMSFYQSLDCGPHCEHALSGFEVGFDVAGDATADSEIARMSAVVRRHRHTLRHLKVRLMEGDGTPPAFANALAECTALTSLYLSATTLPLRSWQQLGPTLRTLVLSKISGDGTDTTFRLLADNVPELCELEFSVLDQLSQDGFIEVVSRLRSLSLSGIRRPWDLVHDAGEWPRTLPKLEELSWSAGQGADAVAVALLRRAVPLRAAHVTHASALAAIAAGPVASDGGRVGDPTMHAPLSTVQTLTLAAVVNDAESLATTLAASPRVSALKLQWGGTAPSELWDLLREVSSAAPPGEESAAGRRGVRRVHLEVSRTIPGFDPEAAARCVHALFPQARYTFFSMPYYRNLLLA
jgi:hypothetical protein